MKTDLFQSYGHCWVFQICWHIECSTFTTSSFRIWNSSTGITLPPLALFTVMLPKAHLIYIPGCLALGWWSHHDYLGHFEGGYHLHYLHHCLASVQITGKEHSPAHQQKIWIKDLLGMAPPIRTRPSFPLSQSLLSGSFHKPLILLHQRADWLKTTVTEN